MNVRLVLLAVLLGTSALTKAVYFPSPKAVAAAGLRALRCLGKKVAVTSAATYAAAYYYVKDMKPELRWDWSKIDTSQVKFQQNFIWGTADCAYQTQGAVGCPESNWADWEKRANLEPSGAACDAWNKTKEDIALMKELGVKAHRFSVDWSRIEPKQGEINESALQHYVDFCDALLAADIKPVVTLHHFVHPQWFEQLGAFEKEENIKYFVQFSERIFKLLGDKVALWCTINEPGVYAFQGYMRGVFPPGKSGVSGMRLAAKVLKNMLNAHVAVYRALKRLPGGDTAQIGLVHQYLMFEKFHDKKSPVKAALEHLIPKLGGLNEFTNSVLEFCKSGKFEFYIPGIVHEKSYNAAAPTSFDFFGLNYYSHVHMRIYHRLKDMIHPGYHEYDIPTDMPYGIYAEGFYRALKHVGELGKPIYVTENGIADKHDNRRDIWLKRYIYAMNRAVAEGCDVRGYFYWSLMDNWEWDMGYHEKFGLAEVNFDTQERKLRKGAAWFKEVVGQTYAMA
jgi:beta-glucosidase